MYCSRVCVGRVVGRDGSKRNRNALTEYQCEWCGRGFLSYYKNRKFCSRKCSGLGRDKPAPDSGLRGGGVDANQPEIVAALRKIGAAVTSATRLGRGFPDLVVGFRGTITLMEIKNSKNSYGRRGFNKNQQRFHDQWRGAKPVIVRSVDDALKAIGAI